MGRPELTNTGAGGIRPPRRTPSTAAGNRWCENAGVERTALAGRIAAVAERHGTFTLRSGATATRYFDKYRFESDPVLLAAVAEQLVPLVPGDCEVLAGLELGGVPVATALSAATGLPAVFVRKQAKPYGTCRLAEGREVDGARLCVVEDVVTTGGQVVASAGDLRALGAEVDRALCVIDRSGGDHRALDGAGLALSALFTEADLVAAT